MTSQGLLREARAVVFSLLCLGVSVALHSWANGALPPVTAVLAGAGLVWIVAIVLAGRERGFPVIATAVLGVQAGLHELFSLVPEANSHTMPMVSHSGLAMLLAHLTAAACAAGWLYGGEVAVWRLVRWLARRVPSLSWLVSALHRRVPPPAPSTRRDRWVEHGLQLPAPVWLRTVLRRGPPQARVAH